jgi:hypothetical protein
VLRGHIMERIVGVNSAIFIDVSHLIGKSFICVPLSCVPLEKSYME